jgi:hypothetical protein
MNKLQIIWIICIINIGILFYAAIWVNSDITLSEKLTFSGVVLFIQSVFGITSYDSYK